VERLFNSLYFDLQSLSRELPDEYKMDYTHWYNKEFIEHRVFQRTMLGVVGRKSTFYYPSKKSIISSDSRTEDKSDPDFYIREGASTFLFECKSIKLNGSIKDKADAEELLRHIKLKLYCSDENLDSTRKKKKNSEKVGVTQIVNHLLTIEDDSPRWDKKMPDDYVFYPIIVVDDWKLAQCGMGQLLNEWYFKLLKEHNLIDEFIKPLVVIPIEIFYFYSDTFRNCGFKKVLDLYYKETGYFFDQEKNEWSNPPLPDFSRWIKFFDRSPVSVTKIENWSTSMIKGS
jgi:hypothetical protein